MPAPLQCFLPSPSQRHLPVVYKTRVESVVASSARTERTPLLHCVSGTSRHHIESRARNTCCCCYSCCCRSANVSSPVSIRISNLSICTRKKQFTVQTSESRQSSVHPIPSSSCVPSGHQKKHALLSRKETKVPARVCNYRCRVRTPGR